MATQGTSEEAAAGQWQTTAVVIAVVLLWTARGGDHFDTQILQKWLSWLSCDILSVLCARRCG